MPTISLTEAARQLGKSERTVRRMIASGQLQGEQIRSGNRYLQYVDMSSVTVPPVAATSSDSAAILAAILDGQERILAALPAIDAKQERLFTELLSEMRTIQSLLEEAAEERQHVSLPPPTNAEAPPSSEKRRWWSWLVWG